MQKTIAPSVETTRDFILIKIPRNLLGGQISPKKISTLKLGLRESMAEALSGNIVGPFRDGKSFLRALKKSSLAGTNF